MKTEIFCIILSALVVVAMGVQAAVCPLGSRSICTAATFSSVIFGFLGLVCLGSCIYLYLDRKNVGGKGDDTERARQDG